MSNYNLSIVTPSGRVFSDEVESLSAPGSEGSLGVLAHHAPMIALLKKGEVIIEQNGTKISFGIGDGVLEVEQNNSVLILTDKAKKNN